MWLGATHLVIQPHPAKRKFCVRDFVGQNQAQDSSPVALAHLGTVFLQSFSYPHGSKKECAWLEALTSSFSSPPKTKTQCGIRHKMA